MDHYIIRHNPRFAVGGQHGLVFAKTPTLALHISARKSSTVSSLFTVCRLERVILGPARHNFFPVPHAPRTFPINKLLISSSKFSNNQALYRDPMPLKAL